MIEWYSRALMAAPIDGTHILVCNRPEFSSPRTFNEAPPVVVHCFDHGFYLSQGIIEGSPNDTVVPFTHWAYLGDAPVP
jgi:hypothetical protein